MVHVDADEVPEKEEKVHEDTCIQSTSTGKFAQIQTYAFSAEPEEKMVEIFFRQNDCFYTKASPKYCKTSYNRKILQEFARVLGTAFYFLKKQLFHFTNTQHF